MAEDQRTARIFGVLFLITFITSIPALALYQPVLDDPAGYIAGGGSDAKIYLGVLLELLLIIANVGTAVVLYPIVRRQNEILSHRLRHCPRDGVRVHRGRDHLRARDRQPASGRPGRFGAGSVARRAQGLDVPPRPRLHRRLGERTHPRLPDVQIPPRTARLAWFGLIGGPLIILSGIGVLFDVFDAGSPVQGLATIPEFIWELSLGIYCAV